MSVNYAAGLSAYDNKGKCGQPERLDAPAELPAKLDKLAAWLRDAHRVAVITGAGVSTSAGIPDFRGPNGVWTLEARGQNTAMNVTFETAVPTYTHRALVAMEAAEYVTGLISQNVDGLHIRSGFPQDRFAELHGNMFLEKCDMCDAIYVKARQVKTMALRPTGAMCTRMKRRGRCRGKLRDTILDWEDALPQNDLDLAEALCRTADLCLCLGTSLQINPCGNLPLATRRRGGRVVIVNLQPTKHDRQAALRIGARVDDVMRGLCERLGVDVRPWEGPRFVRRSTRPVERDLDLHKDTVFVVDEELLGDEKTKRDVTHMNGKVKVIDKLSPKQVKEEPAPSKCDVTEHHIKCEDVKVSTVVEALVVDGPYAITNMKMGRDVIVIEDSDAEDDCSQNKRMKVSHPG